MPRFPFIYQPRMKIYHTVWHKEQTVLLIPIRSPVENLEEFYGVIGNYETYWPNIKSKVQEFCDNKEDLPKRCVVVLRIIIPQPPKKFTAGFLRGLEYAIDLTDYSLISEITRAEKVYDYIDFLGSYDVSGAIFPKVTEIPGFSEFILKGYNLSKTTFPIIYLINYLYDTGRVS